MENKLKARQSQAGSNGSSRVKTTTGEDKGRGNHSSGFSLIELLIVCTVVAIISAIAVPNMISQRRLLRSSAVTREILTQLRYARQLAMSERQAITFQYNDLTKQIRIIDHNNDPTSPTSGTAVLADPSYPNTNSPARVVTTVSLNQGGIPASEIAYGIPTTSTGLPTGHPTIPTSALGDGVTMTPLASNILNITFQADGSVVPKTGIPVGGITLSQANRGDAAMFIFNNAAASDTASAISVLGTSGRVKIWRYTVSGNKYVE
jgi:prepilin-type N-terminal cleavage/methylation domain-containing protein